MQQTTHDSANALKQLDLIEKKLHNKRVAVFLDYDGTLTPIVAHPEDAELSDEMRDILIDLSNKMVVAIVSGRDLRVLQEFIGLENIYYAGSHGFEVAGPNGLHMRNASGKKTLPELDKAEKELRSRLATIDGCQVERKQFAIAVHYRNVAADDVPAVGEIFASVAERSSDLRRRGGKRVYELQPDIDWDKGKAVLWLLSALDIKSYVPVYIGDDLTDEDAFRRLKGRGLGIRVADEDASTSADYLLRDVPEVRQFLEWLAANFAQNSS